MARKSRATPMQDRTIADDQPATPPTDFSQQDPGTGTEDLPNELTENEDGSVTVHDTPPVKKGKQDFGDNLADNLDFNILNSLARTIIDRVELDKEARKQRDKQYEDGLKRSGLGDDAPAGAAFEGASTAVHPLIAEATVDFASAAIKELFPPNGPVKSHILGKETQDKRERARRKVTYLNWQFTKEIEEYRDLLEQVLSQVPLGGSQFMKFSYDHRLQRPTVEFVPIDEVYIPYYAKNFYTAQRITHAQKLTQQEFEERIESGLYRLPSSMATTPFLDSSAASEANDKIEGKEDQLAYDQDGLRSIYEVYLWQRIEGDSFTAMKESVLDEEQAWAPYILTIDVYTEEVLALYRNWREGDQRFKRVEWWVEWGFIPWRGAYKIGLPQLIGGLSAAATGALRALLDSAHVNNTPTAVKLKGGRQSGGNISINPTEIVELEAPAGVDDIRKLMMGLPFNAPSPVLFQLLGFLVDAGKGVVSTSEEKIADASNNMPVGTTMALIEQGAKVYSAIHARLHASQARAMEIVCRLNAQYLDDQFVLQTFGEQIVQKQDFVNNEDVQPVSDPNIFSETQRLARMQAVQQMSQDQRVQWNLQNIYRDMLQQLKVDDADSYLPPAPQPLTSDPVSENVACIMQGVPLAAAPPQDHLAHLHEHLRFLCDPLTGGNPMVQGPQLQPLLAHCVQHLMFQYQTLVQAMAPIISAQNSAAGHPMQPDLLATTAAEHAQTQAKQQLQPLLQLFQQAQQAVQAKMPPPPMDPVQATNQAAMAETQRRADADKQNFQLQTQKQSQDHDLQMAKLQQEGEIFKSTLASEQKQQAQDFLTKIETLAQGQQSLQLLAEKQSGEMDRHFHDLLLQISDRLTQMAASAAGNVQSPSEEQP